MAHSRIGLYVMAGALFTLTAAGAFAEGRMDVIEQELNRVAGDQQDSLNLGWDDARDEALTRVADRSRRMDEALARAAGSSGQVMARNLCWQEVCAVPASVSSSSSKRVYGEVSTPQPESFFDRYLDFKNPRNVLEAGVEWFDYTYREEAFMKLDGSMMGMYVEYTHRFRDNKRVETWTDVWKANNRFNVLMLQTRYSRGDDIKYRSSGTGQAEDEKHSAWESRVLLGYDVPLRGEILVMPYFGLGYRYLLDDNGGTQTSTGHWSYNRESQYVYIPVGVDVTRYFENDWSLGMNLEWDFFFQGQQKSHLGDVPGSTYGTVTNKQNSGYGYRGSIKMIKEHEYVDLVFEPFTRYWHIKDSEVEAAAGGWVYEPKNRTWEFGIRAGIRF